MGTIGPTTNHSTGRDDHPGRPSSFPDGKERKQAHLSPIKNPPFPILCVPRLRPDPRRGLAIFA